MEFNKIYHQSCLTGLQMLGDNTIDCCVSSPPYFGLRDYGSDDQIGMEGTPEEFVGQLVNVFNEVKRVLKPSGTLWLNLGDSYAGSGKGIGDTTGDKWKQSTNKGTRKGNFVRVKTGLKSKDLIGIPWMVAFALRNAGWYLRQDIIWNKPNPMPESVTDRCTKSHEYIFLLSKSAKYYYDADSIKQPGKNPQDDIRRISKATISGKYTPDILTNGIRKNPSVGGKKHKNMLDKGQPVNSFHRTRNEKGEEFETSDGMANKRSVWTVVTKPFKDAHFATFPQELIVDCIKAGCPENGVVIDPFMGGGTTAVVAKKLNRKYIGFEINAEYIKIAEKRLYNEIGLFQ